MLRPQIFHSRTESPAVVQATHSASFSGTGERRSIARVVCPNPGQFELASMLARHDPEQLLSTALDALATGPECGAVLDELPVPIYTTDADGAVTYWNRACIDFAGREPRLGHDRWCVTWQLYTTTGDRLLHEDCPMAQAIKEMRPIRDSIAIAERPDGSRVAFRPYPTPLFSSEGLLT